MIVVCPAREAPRLRREVRAAHVLGLVAPGETPPVMDGDPHALVLAFNDIVAPRPGLVPPDADAIAAILAFGRCWTGERPLLVYCALGISRSPAAAFILACASAPSRPERDLAVSLRAASPCATPNSLMVDLADRQLGRAGRMVAAVSALGRGAEYEPQSGFMLDVNRASVTAYRVSP